MDAHLCLLASATPSRFVSLGSDGSLYLAWDDATFRIPSYDLGFLAALLDEWCVAEELPRLRRGYYRLEHASDGGLLLWLNRAALGLSRDELRALVGLVQAVEAQLVEADLHAAPRNAPPACMGAGYRTLRPCGFGANCQN
jgi:hypothetical protein